MSQETLEVAGHHKETESTDPWNVVDPPLEEYDPWKDYVSQGGFRRCHWLEESLGTSH